MFHLTDSGLPNLYLESGFKTGEDKYGSYYSVEDVEGLYRAIAIALTSGGGTMTALELRLLRKQLGISQATLGKTLGRTEQTLLLWERDRPIPQDAAKHIKLMVLSHLEPRMTLREAFQRLEKKRPANIVMTRVGNEWMTKQEAADRQAILEMITKAAIITSVPAISGPPVVIRKRGTDFRGRAKPEGMPWFAARFCRNP